MIFLSLPLKDAYLIKSEPFKDHRGVFGRVFCKEELAKIGHKKEIVQMNYSLTLRKGTIRGMHFQFPPKSEVKIVWCLRGEIYDVIVDLRKDSATFLKWHGEILSSKNPSAVYVPEGFAHGFQTLSDNCELLYLHTEYYDKNLESGIRYNDPLIKIKWKSKVEDISDRDKNHPYIDKSIFNLNNRVS